MKRTRAQHGVILLLLLAVLFQVQGQTRSAPPRSAPSASAQQSHLKFAIIGDTGTGAIPQYEIAGKLAATRATFPFIRVIMLGDNMYGPETVKDFENKFEKPYADLLTKGVKFYASLGNHDTADKQTSHKLFNMEAHRYYTFKPKNNIEFLALDSNRMDKHQLDWLEGELKNLDSKTWKICFFHHPLYSSAKNQTEEGALRKVLEPLLVKYGVGVVFSGHQHFYERLKPQNRIQYFVLGNSGKLDRGGILANSQLTERGFDTDNAFMVAEIVGDKMNFTTVSRTGVVIDKGTFARTEKRTVN